VNVNALTATTTPGRTYRDMNRPVDWTQQPPKNRRGPMTQDRSFPAGEYCCHPVAVEAEGTVAHSVHAVVDTVQ
jgi:hypothetical protein